MISHQRKRGPGRSRRVDIDPFATVTLLSLASAVQRTLQGKSLRSTSRLHGIPVPHLEALSERIKADPHWTKIPLLLAARRIRGEDLVALERIFAGVDRAALKATRTQLKVIRALGLELKGPRPVPAGLSKAAVDGLEILLSIARLDGKLLTLRSSPGPPRRIEVVSPDPSGAISRHWIEAVALGLLKARLRFLMATGHTAPKPHTPLAKPTFKTLPACDQSRTRGASPRSSQE